MNPSRLFLSVAALTFGLATGCGQIAATPTDPADASETQCVYEMPDGAPMTCPADNTTLCLQPDGCNTCWCGIPEGESRPRFTSCRTLACRRP